MKKESISWRISNCVWKILTVILPSRLFLSLRYKINFGHWINWKNPQSFTEKLQWLKVYGYKPEYTTMVDKVRVKEYIKKKIGEEYVIPTLAIYNTVDDINLASLPEKFVLKTNHDSGTCIVCKNKDTFIAEEAKSKLARALKTNYYRIGKEKPYKYVERRIFAEAFLEHDEDLVDYKFFCFNGEPKILKIDYDRETAHHANYYDIDFQQFPFYKKSSQPETPKSFSKPNNYETMVSIAKKLSEGIPFIRVDLYNLSGTIYFGELTFFPSSGFEPLTDDEWDYKIGSWIKLPQH